jgi:hypothetical protein
MLGGMVLGAGPTDALSAGRSGIVHDRPSAEPIFEQGSAKRAQAAGTVWPRTTAW